MRRWLELRERKGAFTLDDQAEIATTLRDEQLGSLLYAALEMGVGDVTDFTMIPGNRGVLRFYGRLLPLQRRRLLAGQPLAGSELFPYQQTLLARLNQAHNQSAFALAMGAKPRRTPAQLAASRVSLTVPGAPAAPAAPPAGHPAPGPQRPSAPSVYRLRVQFPDGQKDEFMIVMGRVNRPAAPPAPREVPAP